MYETHSRQEASAGGAAGCWLLISADTQNHVPNSMQEDSKRRRPPTVLPWCLAVPSSHPYPLRTQQANHLSW
eukprot:COSAG01_NODE_2020_length_8634_cov_4.835735_2_plen_72_part_00